MQLTTGLKALALGVLLVAMSACKDDGDDSFSFGLDSTQNSPPTISGTPRTKVRAGERYQFTPRAADPDGQPLTFAVANLPGWLSFDASNGRLSGTPNSVNVGSFKDVTLSVSDGNARRTLSPFSIRVEATGTTPSPPPPVEPPDMPSAGGPFRFAEIPEIVFVRGYSETEHLGIFHLDTRNRWTPGDLRNESGWRPRVETRLEVIDGEVDGVTYDPATGILSYDGTGNGTATARVRLNAPTESASSQEFRVRVLEPTVAWGVGAAQRFPGIGHDSGTTSWNDMQRKLRGDAPYESPNVLLVTPGTYSEDFYLQRGLLNLYVIGEPGTRPVLAHDNLNLDGLETGYLKNLELHDTTVNTSLNLEDREVNLYVTQVYQHDSTRDANGFKAPPGSPSAGWQLAVLVLELPRLADGLAEQSAAPDVHRGATRLAPAHQQHPHHGLEGVQRREVHALLRQHPQQLPERHARRAESRRRHALGQGRRRRELGRSRHLQQRPGRQRFPRNAGGPPTA